MTSSLVLEQTLLSERYRIRNAALDDAELAHLVSVARANANPPKQPTPSSNRPG
jgi:hypothetical protein